MKKIFNKTQSFGSKNAFYQLDPNKPTDRKIIIKNAVKKTVKEYRKTLEKLGND